MPVQISVEKSFEREIKRLPPSRQKAVIRALGKFMQNPAIPSLDFRPLAGAPGYYIIDPHKGDRIILRMDAPDRYAAVDVGPHDNVYRRWNR